MEGAASPLKSECLPVDAGMYAATEYRVLSRLIVHL